MKCDAMGIHGLLFYGLGHKAAYSPTRRNKAASNPDGTPRTTTPMTLQSSNDGSYTRKTK